jgi:hypothetical protein
VPASFFNTRHFSGTNPFGTYAVWPTPTGINFQVSVHDPKNKWLLASLIVKSLILAVLTYFISGLLSSLGVLPVMLGLDALLYLCIRRIKLIWIEVRPDGLTITPDITAQDVKTFFDRQGITQRELSFDEGFTFRYGIFDVQATPPFAIEREFEIYENQFEKAISKLWFQENL